MADKINSWDACGINEFLVKACEQMSICAVTTSSENYWQTCRDFLTGIKDLPYDMLSVKQRNWITNIKSDLAQGGMI